MIRKFHNAIINKTSKVECWGDGSAFREFMHVDDLGNASLFALENWDPNHKNLQNMLTEIPLLLNVGTGRDITIRSLAEKISSILDFKGDIVWDTSKPNGTPRKLLNSDRLKSWAGHPI